jgi:hypothetical protein
MRVNLRGAAVSTSVAATVHEAYWCSLNLSMSSKPQVWLRLKTQSPSTLRWRLRGQVSHIRRFEKTVKSATQIGLMDGRQYRGRLSPYLDACWQTTDEETTDY